MQVHQCFLSFIYILFRNIMVLFSSSSTLGCWSNFIVMIITAFMVMCCHGQMSFWCYCYYKSFLLSFFGTDIVHGYGEFLCGQCYIKSIQFTFLLPFVIIVCFLFIFICASFWLIIR